MFLAPLPVLFVAPHVSSVQAFLTAAAAWAIGALNTWTYYRTLELPVGVRLIAVCVPALVFGGSVLLYRAFLRRGQPVLAVLAFPVSWVGYQYLLSLSAGSYSNIAYTQMDFLPLLQLAAVTGMWGIGFVVFLVPAGIAATTFATSGRGAVSALVVSVLSAALAFGFVRLSNRSSDWGEPVTVGLAASDLRENRLPEKPADAMRALRQLAGQVDGLAQRGARIVAFPEMSAVLSDELMPQVDAVFGAAARTSQVEIILPVLHWTGRKRYNEARVYEASGAVSAVYRKHHLVPVFEDKTTPGTELETIRRGQSVLGLQICRDMDYPALSRRYGQLGAGPTD